jgi:hypothetical protein
VAARKLAHGLQNRFPTCLPPVWEQCQHWRVVAHGNHLLKFFRARIVETADYFRGVRQFFFEINRSTGMVFDLEANDLIGLKLAMAD